MEEIEGVEILSDQHTNEILGHNKTSKSKKASNSKVQNVLLTAGRSGIIKIYSIEINGNDINSFVYELLLQIPLSYANVNSGTTTTNTANTANTTTTTTTTTNTTTNATTATTTTTITLIINTNDL